MNPIGRTTKDSDRSSGFPETLRILRRGLPAAPFGIIGGGRGRLQVLRRSHGKTRDAGLWTRITPLRSGRSRFFQA